MNAAIRQAEALDFQRTRQQGRGRPIVSAEVGGMRIVAIGGKFVYGNWPTFHHFLIENLKEKLGREWGIEEINRPMDHQHPIIRWCTVLSELMEKRPEGSDFIPGHGAAQAIYGLAYDLYLIEHHAESPNDEHTFKRLLERLKSPDQFFGARHEARSAGLLLRAGFSLAWENEESRRPGGHCEFIATFPQTGRSFWVECKMRQSARDDGSVGYTHLVSAALRKSTTLERLIFVELNLPNGRIKEDGEGWPGWAVNQLRNLESQPSASELPPALILITNFPAHRYLDSALVGTGALLEGFKTERYRLGEKIDLLDAVEERERNPEIECLWRSIQEHAHIPVTFDGSIPGLRESDRLLIGESYVLPTGEEGVLEDATVSEQTRKAMTILRLHNGERIAVEFELSQEELEAWRQHPETFFGEFQAHAVPPKNAMDLFLFFADAYSGTPKEELLHFMVDHSNIESMRGLSQAELVKQYAHMLTAAIIERGEQPPTPTWHSRLKRIRSPRKS